MASHFLGLRIVSVLLAGMAVAAADLSWAQSRKPLSEQDRAAILKLHEEVFRLNDSGNGRQALPLAKQLLALRRQFFAETSFDVAVSKNALAYALAQSNDLKSALPLYRDAVRDLEQHRGADSPDTTTVRVNLADTCSGLGQYSEALELYEKSLAIRRRTLGEEHILTAKMHNSVGYCQQQLGEFAAARSHYERAIAITRKQSDAHGQLLVQSLNNLASVLQMQGNVRGATTVYEEALQIALKSLDEHNDLIAALSNNLGSIYRERSDLVKARDAFQRALAIREKSVGKTHVLYSVVLGNLAGVQFDLKEYAAARVGFEKCLEIQRASVGEAHPIVAQSLHYIARTYRAEKDYDKARPIYRDAIDRQLAALGGEHPETILTRWDFARNELLAGQLAAGREQIDLARRAARAHIARVLPGMSDREQLVYLREVESPRLREALANAFVRSKRPDWCEASAEWLANGKGIGQESLAVREQLLRTAAAGNTSPDVEKLLNVRRRLAAVSMGGESPAGSGSGKESLASLQTEEAVLARRVQRELGRAGEPGQWQKLDDIRRCIPSDTLFIDIARFYSSGLGGDRDHKQHRYAAWIVPPAGQGTVSLIPLGTAAELEATSRRVREQVMAAVQPGSSLRTHGEPAATRELAADLERLQEQLWRPLAAAVPKGTRHLIISPDGDLWLVPWAAIPVSPDRPLIEDYSLKFVTSARDLANKAPPGTPPTTKSLLVADPDFDLPPESVRTAIQSIDPRRKLGPIVQRDRLKSSFASRAARLPNTRVEAELIAPSIEKVTGTEARVCLDRLALETVVKDTRRPRMLVLSTHGFFLPGAGSQPKTGFDNPLLQCGLLLAGCSSKAAVADDDGILTGLEIVNVDLAGTELVVLSACETAIGAINIGEGVAGLRQAFQLAGARSVVATLWQVPDRDSTLLMTDFFANLAAGQAKSEALQNAQRSRIAARRARYGAAHPFYWAAWTVTGE